jgi:hypothetical protein
LSPSESGIRGQGAAKNDLSIKGILKRSLVYLKKIGFVCENLNSVELKNAKTKVVFPLSLLVAPSLIAHG